MFNNTNNTHAKYKHNERWKKIAKYNIKEMKTTRAPSKTGENSSDQEM